jgi:hypothetical protein
MKTETIQILQHQFDAISQRIPGEDLEFWFARDLQGEQAITREHIQNHVSVRDMLGQRGIRPEKLSPEEDIKKLERRLKTEEKKLEKKSGRLPEPKDE